MASESKISDRVRRWKSDYVEKFNVSPDVLRDFGDDIAHLIMTITADGEMSTKAAYDAVVKGLYESGVSQNQSRRRGSKRRGSRR